MNPPPRTSLAGRSCWRAAAKSLSAGILSKQFSHSLILPRNLSGRLSIRGRIRIIYCQNRSQRGSIAYIPECNAWKIFTRAQKCQPRSFGLIVSASTYHGNCSKPVEIYAATRSMVDEARQGLLKRKRRHFGIQVQILDIKLHSVPLRRGHIWILILIKSEIQVVYMITGVKRPFFGRSRRFCGLSGKSR